MPNQTTSNASNSVRVQYQADYIEGAVLARLYDQFASPVGADMSNLKRGSSVTVPFLSSMTPTTQTISEIADVTPTTLADTTVSVTPTSRANAIVISEKLKNTSYTDIAGAVYKRLGENMMESVDALALSAAVSGGLLKRTQSTRAALDAGTSTDRMTKANFAYASVVLSSLKVPMYVTPRGKRWITVMHPFAFNDLMQDSVVLAVGEYSKPEMILNYELGELNGFSIVVSPWAKMFWGAGAANGTAVSTTVATTDIAQLATSMTVASATNIAVGQRLTLGTPESSTTYYLDNEQVIVKSVSGTTIGFIGEGENGGCRFAHAIGTAVKNTDSVAAVVFGGPESLGKVYDTEVGEYGQIVGPKTTGLVDQFETLGWKWYGNYGIVAENRILRAEVSTSIDA